MSDGEQQRAAFLATFGKRENPEQIKAQETLRKLKEIIKIPERMIELHEPMSFEQIICYVRMSDQIEKLQKMSSPLC